MFEIDVLFALDGKAVPSGVFVQEIGDDLTIAVAKAVLDSVKGAIAISFRELAEGQVDFTNDNA